MGIVTADKITERRFLQTPGAKGAISAILSDRGAAAMYSLLTDEEKARLLSVFERLEGDGHYERT